MKLGQRIYARAGRYSSTSVVMSSLGSRPPRTRTRTCAHKWWSAIHIYKDVVVESDIYLLVCYKIQQHETKAFYCVVLMFVALSDYPTLTVYD
jgi:hypothetical protein